MNIWVLVIILLLVGGGGGYGVFGTGLTFGLLHILWIVVVVALIVWLVRAISSGPRGGPGPYL